MEGAWEWPSATKTSLAAAHSDASSCGMCSADGVILHMDAGLQSGKRAERLAHRCCTHKGHGLACFGVVLSCKSYMYTQPSGIIY